jgi:ribonuclease BN (tRNA processing enzyme)
VQVLSPDVPGQIAVVAGARPCHAAIEAACDRADLLFHEAWAGDAAAIARHALPTAAAAGALAAALGADTLLLIGRGRVGEHGAAAPCTDAGDVAAMREEARRAAPGAVTVAPQDLELLVFRHPSLLDDGGESA